MGRHSDGKKRLRPELLSGRGLYPGEPEKRVWNFGGRQVVCGKGNLRDGDGVGAKDRGSRPVTKSLSNGGVGGTWGR